MNTSPQRSTRTRKALSVGAAGTVLAIGAVSTLAAWNDSEWVTGLFGETGGIGTSVFEVQQNRSQGAAVDTWEDRESIERAGDLEFTPGEIALTPGDTVYAPVALRTTANSLGGTVTLQRAVGTDEQPLNTPLANALEYRVGVTDTASDCHADTFGVFAQVFTEPALLSADIKASTQTLEPGGGHTQYYCFEVTLPESASDREDLQAELVTPHWEFHAESASANQG